MARVALGLSIFAFIPPLGIAAIVLGHTAERRIDASSGTLDGKSLARSALWIAYLQLAMVSVAGLVLWNLLGATAVGFRRDAAVQRYLRETEHTQPLDPESAQDAERTAKALMYQFISIEEEARRYSDSGIYACNLDVMLTAGMKGASEAENRAFAARVAESPYTFTISQCNPRGDGSQAAGYTLVAVPRLPRMPTESKVFCTDQSGVLMQVRGGTSVDCLKHGEPAN
jgi:hypothetical protein